MMRDSLANDKMVVSVMMAPKNIINALHLKHENTKEHIAHKTLLANFSQS